MTIQILDCTLRDGGYINNWNFSPNSTIKMLNYLGESKIDKVEIGYISTKRAGLTKFNLIKDIEEFISEFNIKLDNEIWTMLNFGEYNIKDLTKSEIVDGIRIAFRKESIVKLESIISEIKEKNYKISLQPMITNIYSYGALDALIDISNEYEVESLYIVDSFGSMFYEDINRIFTYINNKLSKNIKIGFHGHNNINLVEYNAFSLINNASDRDVIIDSTLFGIGRGGGNLSTEALSTYLNRKNVIYELESIFNALEVLSQEFPNLGIKPKIFNFICGLYHCHPSYASEFINNSNEFHLKDAYKLLEKFKNKDK